MDSQIRTSFLILSDTHGEQLNHLTSIDNDVDVIIHCGDLTEESKLDEFKATLSLLQQLPAPLKLVIAGNHDFTLDTPTYKKKINNFKSTYNTTDTLLLEQEFGTLHEAKQLFEDAKDSGILLLSKGIHKIALKNGALLTVYASPFTPSSTCNMAFQYNSKEENLQDWAIDSSVDIVITHGPPKGILDYTNGERAGSSSLFKAIAQAKPQLHCFGHIHEAWGARCVAWHNGINNENLNNDNLNHFTAINNIASTTTETLKSVRPYKFDTMEELLEKQLKCKALDKKGYCIAKPPLDMQTLFVNAAIEGPADDLQQWPWKVDINLPKLSKKRRLSNADADTEKAGKKLNVQSTI